MPEAQRGWGLSRVTQLTCNSAKCSKPNSSPISLPPEGAPGLTSQAVLLQEWNQMELEADTGPPAGWARTPRANPACLRAMRIWVRITLCSGLPGRRTNYTASQGLNSIWQVLILTEYLLWDGEAPRWKPETLIPAPSQRPAIERSHMWVVSCSLAPQGVGPLGADT